MLNHICSIVSFGCGNWSLSQESNNVRTVFRLKKKDDESWTVSRLEMLAMGEVVLEEGQAPPQYKVGGGQTVESHGMGKDRRFCSSDQSSERRDKAEYCVLSRPIGRGYGRRSHKQKQCGSTLGNTTIA